MNINQLTKTQKLTISAMVTALYIVILYVTQGFSFGAFQIRIATSLYGLGYLCPFLIIPLGLANFISNMLFGGLGIWDMLGGCLVGMLATFSTSLIRKYQLSKWWMALAITLIPGLLVPTWLSYLLALPYFGLALSLCIGQTVPGICSVLLVSMIEKTLLHKEEVHI
ncbi:QueT transporter family protein [Anaeromicropila populeti]|uniref:QueT transporter n=1 Tax=Anaeromicropila populeti TaxID=37658 RepID=A0A1I6JLV2_9FIRM|nr:QueT transporter family protein [Anaeromicropila populeti]SFR79958.1 QueT transporter [Anaeromicropila populeti]